MPRVMVTGIGLVSPLGAGAGAFWEGMLAEPARAVEGFSDLGGKLPNKWMYLCPDRTDPGPGKGRASEMSLRAAAQALDDAGLSREALAGAGIAVGTTMGDEEALERRRGGGSAPEYPFQIAADLALRFGCEGPNHTISNACTSGLYAIDIAAEAIRAGESEIMIAGGVEAASRVVVACFNRLGALDDQVCRPFDRGRKGTVLGEGAAFVVLESEASWRARGGARPYGALKGSGWSCDAHQPTAPDPAGEQIERAMRESLSQSGCSPADIDCVLPHATGTPLNDAVEAKVLGRVFSGCGTAPALTAIKSRLGHSGGASGAFSLATACLIMRHGRVPGTAHVRDPEFAMPMRMPLGSPLAGSFANVLVSAYAFGGNNISVVVGEP